MDERVKKCLDKVCEAYKELLASASNEAEAVCLFAVLQYASKEAIDKALNEGFEEFENRKKEGN